MHLKEPWSFHHLIKLLEWLNFEERLHACLLKKCLLDTPHVFILIQYKNCLTIINHLLIHHMSFFMLQDISKSIHVDCDPPYLNPVAAKQKEKSHQTQGGKNVRIFGWSNGSSFLPGNQCSNLFYLQHILFN